MAPLTTTTQVQSCSFCKLFLVLCLALILLAPSFISASSNSRRLLEQNNIDDDDNDDASPKKKSISINDNALHHPIKKKKLSLTNSTKSTTTTTSSSSFGSTKINQTKLAKTKIPSLSDSTKNKTKLTPEEKLALKSQLKKLNYTTKKSSLDLSKTSSSFPKNKTTKVTNPMKDSESKSKSKNQSSTDKKHKEDEDDESMSGLGELPLPSKKQKTLLPDLEKTSNTSKINHNKAKVMKNKTTNVTTPLKESEPKSKSKKNNSNPKKETTKAANWLEEDEDDDFMSGLGELPSKFQETLLPDLERISKTSKIYLNKANKEMTRNFKPIVGHKYAATIASAVSFAFILIPLILVSLIFNRIKAYFSLQRLLIFIQVYLSIYFSILCLSTLLTGLEPLKFLYATSQSTYICLHLLQTLAYVLYLLMLLMYLVLVFSTETGPITKIIGLAQTFVGFAVGLHYYMTVFHRAVLRQPPKTSWRMHATYATCFLLICLLSRAERTKKTYLQEGGDEGKKS